MLRSSLKGCRGGVYPRPATEFQVTESLASCKHLRPHNIGWVHREEFRVDSRPSQGTTPRVRRPISYQAGTDRVLEQIFQSCRDVLVATNEVVVKTPLPQRPVDPPTHEPGSSTFEQPHEIDQRTVDIEDEQVDMIRHDAVPKHRPSLAVQPAYFGEQNFRVVGLTKNRCLRFGAGGKQHHGAGLSVYRIVDANSLSSTFRGRHAGRISGTPGGDEPLPYGSQSPHPFVGAGFIPALDHMFRHLVRQ